MEELKRERWLLWQTIAQMRGVALPVASDQTGEESQAQAEQSPRKPWFRPNVQRLVQKIQAKERDMIETVEKNLRLARDERLRQGKVKTHTDPRGEAADA